VPGSCAVIMVDDTLKAYQDIAAFWRKGLKDLKVVAVTGSNGKTSTKDMIAACLEGSFRVAKTQGNFNNEVGMPRTLLSISKDTQIAVVEMGMRGLGQIRAMCKVASPDAAVITNVGETHLGELGSMENIASAKSEILEDLPEDGFAVLNGDNSWVRKMAPKAPRRTFWFGFNDGDDPRAENVKISDKGSSFDCILNGERAHFDIPWIGEHNVMNCLAAIAVAGCFGVKLNDMAGRLERGTLTSGRQEILDFDGITVINDAYNASPASMQAAFETLRRLKKPGGRTIALVADMLELGSVSEESHSRVGDMAADSGTDLLLSYGKEMELADKEAKKRGLASWHFDSVEAACAHLAGLVKKGDVVLLKGSHSMRVDKALDLVFNEDKKN